MGCNASKNISTRDVKIISKDKMVNSTIIDDKYPFPKKDYGGDRLALQHRIFKYIWQSDFSAPVNEKLETGAKVLDFGCGTATWLIDLSSQYPNSSFFGVEKPTPVFHSFTPPIPSRVSLQYCDILSRLPFEDETFDFIYVRFMAFEIPDNKFKDLINELTRILKIDGYLEIMDTNAQASNEGIETQEFMSSVRSYYKSIGMNPLITESLEPLLRSNSHLTSITTEKQCYPIGNWDDPIGEIALENLLLVLKHSKNNLAPHMKVNEDEYDRKLLNIKEEVNLFQTYRNCVRVYGKKLA
ncbi:S-adenosyl-L-methionine-dependent methyltransferase [Gigaspora rosea]|uniref:S-adenosyl-L-methionine-dependent methyltransferase n=1 Tax=Gigaspora rosea TaxID=44941 RepID=A0A397VWD5_9GLOM|nr:S-adenosyl-L-methionine-dependent methyltransferase [Gigaspora rosea]